MFARYGSRKTEEETDLEITQLRKSLATTRFATGLIKNKQISYELCYKKNEGKED